jgi:hypothetical protein
MAEPNTEAKTVRTGPVIETLPTDEKCGVVIAPAIKQSNKTTDRLARMLAAALPGVRVRRSVTGELGDLQVERDKHYVPLAHLTPGLVNEFLTKLPAAPVLALTRHPSKPFVWLLVLGFRVYRDHEKALERIPGVINAVADTDQVYGRYKVELFVPGLGLTNSEDGEAEGLLLKSVQGLFDFRL